MNTMTMRLSAMHAVVALAPVLLAVLLARLAPVAVPTLNAPELERIAAENAAELETVFELMNYRWPPVAPGDAADATLPPVAVETMPADLHTLPVDARKALFFRVLAPLVAAENRVLEDQRHFLLQAFAEHPRLPESGEVAERVRALANRFNVGGDLDRPATRELLLRRVDVVPTALVLAQAANESGWGTSRFAREANNLFGMWTWDADAGIAPLEHDPDSRHFVRVFADLRAAVKNYLHTINVGPAYHELRRLRAAHRMRGESPDALQLAAGLKRYSARGEQYVREIRSIIEYNRLHELPPLTLTP